MKKSIQIGNESQQNKVIDSKQGISISRTGKPVVGRVPELLKLDLRCATTRKDFYILIEGGHTDQVKPYKVTQIVKEGDISQKDAVSSSRIKTLDIDISEIQDIHSIKCPYCRGGQSSFVRCACGGHSCSGGVKRKGGIEYHYCPWCKTEGMIAGCIETISGQRSSKHATLGTKGSSQQLPKSTTDTVKVLQSGSKQVKK